MKNSLPLISIISVNFNAAATTVEFLHSIKNLDYPNIEVIVVDNASDDQPIEGLRRQFPTVQFIVSEVNRGFAGGNNLGIKAAKGDFLFFVNNDTTFGEDLLYSLLSVFNDDDRIGGVSPKIIYEGTEIIQYAGFTSLSLIMRNQSIGHQCKDAEEYNDVILTPYLHGAAMLISRKVIDRVGLMPEIYFLYYEELDWSEQMRIAGFQLAVDRRVAILHKASVSVGKNSPLKTYFMMRNRWLFVRRNGKPFQKVFYFLYVSLVVFPKEFFNYLFRLEWKQIQSLIRGYFWNYSNKSL
ncbi:MAG: GT2 family glycosyltransferase [Parvicella sp.]|jgi:GT2 family glycosyltransferase